MVTLFCPKCRGDYQILKRSAAVLGSHNIIVSRSFIKPQKPMQPLGTDDEIILKV